ncbi:MAG: sulfur carrier protein ThiS [Candidatus Dormibacteria bacterium]
MAEAGQAVLTVNGDTLPAAGSSTLGQLLGRLGVDPQRVVVELNGTIHRRGEGLQLPVRAGDVVEIVHFVGGG